MAGDGDLRSAEYVQDARQRGDKCDAQGHPDRDIQIREAEFHTWCDAQKCVERPFLTVRSMIPFRQSMQRNPVR